MGAVVAVATVPINCSAPVPASVKSLAKHSAGPRMGCSKSVVLMAVAAPVAFVPRGHRATAVVTAFKFVRQIALTLNVARTVVVAPVASAT
jgi:hypothetical protein